MITDHKWNDSFYFVSIYTEKRKKLGVAEIPRYYMK